MAATAQARGQARGRSQRAIWIAVLTLSAIWLVIARPPLGAQASTGDQLILISLDGFRWDYLEKAPSPHLHGLVGRGIRARGLIPSFPTVTFPNHYTVVTGLYPGHHGIVGNNMRDPSTGRSFAPSKKSEVRDGMWWQGATPLWVTAERAGKHAATMFWPGSEAAIRGVRPSYWVPFDKAVTGEARVDQILRWLDLPMGQRPAFFTLYFEDTDEAGHDHGPDSEAVRQAITRVDGYVGRLLRGLESRGLTSRTNVVVLSDHGMAAVVRGQVLDLSRIIDLAGTDVVSSDPTLELFPASGKGDAIYQALKGASPHLRMYRRSDTPPAWHYRDHPRIPPLVGVADEGWLIVKGTVVERAAQALGLQRGAHAYDPSVESMRGIFIAAGPAFKRGVTVPAFENVHVYGALAAALGVKPEPNDGDMTISRTVLR
jgi:predicted AlkP superfamily pyrophosphatase or phosphodiesterase